MSFEPLYQVFQNTSCHAGNWLELTKSPILKLFIMVFLIPIHILLVYFFISQTFLRQSTESITSLHWQSNNFLIGPNITVCNPRMFDRSKVEGNFFNFIYFW